MLDAALCCSLPRAVCLLPSLLVTTCAVQCIHLLPTRCGSSIAVRCSGVPEAGTLHCLLQHRKVQLVLGCCQARWDGWRPKLVTRTAVWGVLESLCKSQQSRLVLSWWGFFGVFFFF